jgi:DNA-directed RNA polymerase subunit beta
VDDIDHLGNRRIRTVGELMADQFRVGLWPASPGGCGSACSWAPPTPSPPPSWSTAAPWRPPCREFFSRSQLSQFKDETNPLSSLRHKRRISALGPGGLTRERAGFDVRDVHRTHYGRICPVETPEGANIGLITSLAAYARVDALGFIRTPYRRVRNGMVTEEVVYMTASEEDRYTIAQANTPLEGDRIAADRVVARRRGEPVIVTPEEVEFMDVSPKQVFSVNTNLIPFLEHDDANRALMGSNMQTQAVPLIRAQAPVVMTGLEERVVRDSLAALYAEGEGEVVRVDGTRIAVRYGDGRLVEYPLRRYRPLQPGHRLGPAPPGQGGPAGEEGRPPGGRPRLRGGLFGPGTERPGGHHAL